MRTQLELVAGLRNLRCMTSRPVFDEPSKTVVVDGEIVVFGPEGVGHSFTPQAARETARRLSHAADEADGVEGDDGEVSD